jgi:hypothetical protein
LELEPTAQDAPSGTLSALAVDVPALAAEVPEPVSLILFGVGLGAVAYRLRSRRV